MVPAPKRADEGTMRDLSFETARLLIPQLRSAWRDVCEGRASTFQYQAVEIAIQPISFVKRIGVRWKPIFDLGADVQSRASLRH